MIKHSDLELARYEIKFTLQRQNYYRFKNWLLLNPHDFYVPYPSRIVNNIYFDTLDCDSYVENLTGCTSRTKLRLRWYGDTFNPQKAVLELKAKRNRLGFKGAHKISFEGMKLSSMSYKDIVGNIKSQITGDIYFRFQQSDVAIIINRYERDYFITRNMKTRATLDSNLTFFDQRNRTKPNSVFKSITPEICIFEVKTPSLEIDYAEKVIETIELPPSKSSKYVLGVQSLIGYQ
jgi:hypothetical protein